MIELHGLSNEVAFLIVFAPLAIVMVVTLAMVCREHKNMRRNEVRSILQNAEVQGIIDNIGREWLSRKMDLGEFKERKK